MSMNDLKDVLVDTLKDLYHAEKQLVKALPKMAKAASDDELRNALEEHLTVTEGQVSRLEEIFGELDMTPRTKVCHGMAGLIEEGKEVIEEKKSGESAAIDAALIAGAQKVEHYEITSYGSARAFAEQLGLDRVAELLQQTLQEEEEADEKLSKIALESVNQRAMTAGAEETDEDEAAEERPSRAGASRSGGGAHARAADGRAGAGPRQTGGAPRTKARPKSARTSS